MGELQKLQLSFGRRGAEGKPLSMVFDLAYPTQKLLYQFSAQRQVCDPPLVRALTEFLEPGDTFIDVGAHIGYFGLLALQMVGANGCVLAFEPNPATFAVLAANSLLNREGRFYAYNSAVGDRPGTAAFYVHTQDEGMSSLVAQPQGGGGGAVNVHVTTLDAVAQLAQVERVRMLKIDVEGFEEQVLRGAKEMLSRGHIESIVFEVNNTLNGVPPGRDRAIRRFLREFGYSFYLIRPWMTEPEWERACGGHNYLRLGEEVEVNISFGNILATKRAVDAAG